MTENEKLQEIVDFTIEEQSNEEDPEPTDDRSKGFYRGWECAMECVRLEICNLEGFEPNND